LTQKPLHQKINIRPDVSVYATYRRLSYTPWHAIAEFVDNSTQNYFNFKEDLLRAYKREGKKAKLRVEVDYDQAGKKLTIYDNANGMNGEELGRAVALDKPPPDTSGRSEYGMGLKTAACWFGTTWSIRTTRLGSKKELSVKVHVPDLVAKHTEELDVREKPEKPENHFTEIVISGLYKPIHGRTSQRVFDQLGSMYRVDLRSKEIDILWRGHPVAYNEPPVLKEDHKDGSSTLWKKEIKFMVPSDGGKGGLAVSGWLAVMYPGSQRDAGFALLRRGRVVIGGPGEGYKPTEIFGQGNTYRSQRLFGELQMDDWPVTQAKDGFDWHGDLEEGFKEELRKASKDYMDHAEVVRVREKPVTKSEMEMASESTRKVFSDPRFGEAIADEIRLPEPRKSVLQELRDSQKLKLVSDGPVPYRLKVGEEEWHFRLHWQEQVSDTNWMSVTFPQENEIEIFLNMAHPFIAEYRANQGFLEILQKFVLALALAEKIARKTARNGLISPEDLRTYMNRVLKWASKIEVEENV
jgi:Histidine kinase-, DNA gyrase B-, and HSP90-like ATPase